ncbi:MAG: hypothetical protein ACOH2N_11230 [Devosia sp.]
MTATGTISFESPTWLLGNNFTIREAAEVIGVPDDTLTTWLGSASLMGIPLHTKAKHRRLMTGHNVYVAGILAALHRENIPCSPRLIHIAHNVTHDDGVPRLPGLMERTFLSEFAPPYPPSAVISVDLSAVWIEIEPKLTALVADA